MKITFTEKVQRCDDLVCGYKGKEIEFKHKAYRDRSRTERARYDSLRDHLRDNGMLNPVCTFQGHVLVGQRRFEIMRYYADEIATIEVEQDLYEWPINRVTEITNAVKIYYHQQEHNKTIPRGL